MNMRNLLRKMGQKSFRAGQRGGDVLPQRDRAGDDQGDARGDGRRRLQGAARRPTTCCAACANKQTAAPPATRRHGAAQGAGDPLRQQEDAGRPAEEDGAGAARHRGQRTTSRSSATRRRPTPTPRRCSTSPAAARSGCSRRSAWRRRRCCGTPACRPCCRRATCAAAIRSAARGQYDKAEKIITDNRVLFHRVANTLNYLDIKTVVVSCGTCYDQLQGYKFEEIFPGCRIIDIHEFLLEKGITLGGRASTRRAGYLYHDPCHSPMKLHEPLKTVKALVGDERAEERPLLRRVRHASASPGPTSRPRCAFARKRSCARTRRRCARRSPSRAGASPRRPQDPDLAARAACRACSATRATCRTACSRPTTSSSRWRSRILGEDWMPEYVERANDGGIERVLV